jgi:hypothetical protein
MFGKVIRFDGDGNQLLSHEASASFSEVRASDAALPQRTDDAESVSAPHQQGSGDPEWVRRLLDRQKTMLDSARREQLLAVAELIRIAQVLCKDSWDAQSRSGQNPDAWPPKRVADLIIADLTDASRNAQLAQDPALSEKYHRMTTDLASAYTEIDTLRQRVRAAEDMVREMKDAAAKEAQRRQEAAEKKVAATLAVNKMRYGPQQQIRAHQNQVGMPEPPSINVPPIEAHESDNNKSEPQNNLIPEATPAQLATANARVVDVIRVVAEYGLCRWKDISHQLAEQWGKRLTSGAMDHSISKSITFGLLKAEEVPLEWGGRPTGKMLILTEQGMQWALALGMKPVESQYSRGIAMHKSGAHFYVILEVAGILATRYGSVDCFPPYILVGDEKYYPDITVLEPGGNKIGVEVERGTYKAQRDDKWLRAAAANSGTIYVVTPNQEAMLAIAAEIEQVREQHPGQVRRILAFNVRSYRENRGDSSASLWAYEG